jgi:LEA14-like dessication related protein
MPDYRASWIALSIALLLSTGCATLSGLAEPPKVTLVDLQPTEMTLFEQRFLVRLRIQNPNPEPLDVTGMSYEVDINDRAFAEGVHGTPFVVAPYGEQVIDVMLGSTLFNVIDQFQGLTTERRTSLTYTLSGSLSVAGSLTRIRFERSGELDFEGLQSGTPL